MRSASPRNWRATRSATPRAAKAACSRWRYLSGRDTIRVAVADAGSPLEPAVIEDPCAEHGRGLLLVRGLSWRMGITGGRSGRVIWADIPRGGPDAVQHARDLLARTADLTPSASPLQMMRVLSEYRAALHALAVSHYPPADSRSSPRTARQPWTPATLRPLGRKSVCSAASLSYSPKVTEFTLRWRRLCAPANVLTAWDGHTQIIPLCTPTTNAMKHHVTSCSARLTKAGH